MLNSKMTTENSLTSNLEPVPIDIDQFFVNCDSLDCLVFICPLPTSPLPSWHHLFKIEKKLKKKKSSDYTWMTPRSLQNYRKRNHLVRLNWENEICITWKVFEGHTE